MFPATFVEWLCHRGCFALKSPADICQSALQVRRSRSLSVSVEFGGL